MKAVFDSNIIIDYLNGVKPAKKEIEKYSKKLISIITWIEVLAGCGDENSKIVRSFLNDFEIVDISYDIAEISLEVRKKKKIKLPDALIYATAMFQECPLVTRNTKDFKESYANIIVPY
jgi:hypothetical protein